MAGLAGAGGGAARMAAAAAAPPLPQALPPCFDKGKGVAVSSENNISRVVFLNYLLYVPSVWVKDCLSSEHYLHLSSGSCWKPC